MAFCTHCGTQNVGGKFCAQCGAPLAQTPPARRTGQIGLIIAAIVAMLVVGGGAALLLGRSAEPAAVTANTPSTAAPSGGKAPASRLPSDPNNPLVGGFVHMRVPGTAYTQSDGTNLNLYVSTGAMTASSLLINADGTYAWNSQWDGKIIQGTWVKQQDGNLVLQKGQEGKDWVVTPSNQGGDILVMTDSVWYIADRAKE
jgi:hypothetical protein